MNENTEKQTPGPPGSEPSAAGRQTEGAGPEGHQSKSSLDHAMRSLVCESKDALGVLSKEVAGELKKPTTGAAVAGAAVVGAAVVFGAAEAAVGALAAYAVHRMLKNRGPAEK